MAEALSVTAVLPDGASIWQRMFSTATAQLPRGGALPLETWRRRHRGITVLLWMHVVALTVIGVILARPMAQLLLTVGAIVCVAIGAGLPRCSVTTRSALATLGLVGSAATLVLFFDGRTEMHFHYFVVVAVVALYQAWEPYLLAVAFVLVQHGIVGTIAPQLVFGMSMSASGAWKMALLHSAFILAESVACVMFWRLSEDAVDNAGEALSAARSAHLDLVHAQEMANIGSWALDVATNRLTWSDQMFTVTGQDRHSYVPSLATGLDLVHPDDRERVRSSLTAAFNTGRSLELEYRFVRPSGEIREVHAISEQPVSSDGTSPTRRGTVHDITEQRALQREIEHLAFHDALTGLANRRLFLDRLDHVLTQRRTPGVTTALLYLDLDDFKLINDTFGHSVGDELLRTTATRLQDSVRSGDTVARLGGDEFAILLERVDYATTRRIADLIGIEVRRPMSLDDAELSIQTSIGFALAGDHSTADHLIRKADAAMYAMKASN